ncbi:MAG: 50S ribosomal protein L3 [Patescibacteria group bacterium]
MKKIILGTKENMTQVFGADGIVYPVTVIKTGPVVVTQVKNKEKDGYTAVQVGFGEKKAKNINKALQGHLKDLGNFRFLKEFRLKTGSKKMVGQDGNEFKVGDKIDVSVFAEGDKVNITSTSKGKGFQGVVKRHGFHGGSRTHGQKHSEREPGSIGATGPQRVFKGVRMAGRMGSDRTMVKNLKVVQVDKENNQLLVKGAIAGRRGSLVEIRG